MTEKNIFDQIEEQSNVLDSEVPHIEEKNNSNSDELPVTDEIDFTNLSDKAVGEQTKYERENLDGQIVKIVSAKMFNPDTVNDEIKSSMSNSDVKYYKTKFILTYDKENKDGVKNREYLSGAIQFIQKDGSISSPSIWYEGAENQIASLFNKVAEFKGVNPKELSPREFMNFLNSGPKVLLKYTEVKFNKDVFHKNLVEKFIK